ncbi:aldehyde dehydrogenase family protein [Alcaligenes sp. RM2]|uniref:aldehyde dehydrogenase family protein n=1 Tax=Alcaligenes TaxID=507 RepID=UPI0009E9CD4D
MKALIDRPTNWHLACIQSYVWINRYLNLRSGSPFGGMKESGIGREHCRETLNIYSELKAITVQNSLPQPGFAV